MGNKRSVQSQERDWGYLIGGEFRTSGEPLTVHSPFDQSEVGVAYWTPETEIEEAIRQAQASADTMATMPTFERGALLRRMSEGVEARKDELVRLLALEAGKPVKAGRVEVERCIFNLRNASEEAQRIEHELLDLDLIPASRNRIGLVRRVPLGLIYAITPFNFPLNLVAHKVAPALAAGNTLLQKPSPKTPLCSIAFAEIAQQAGVPAGALNVINCPNERAEQLAEDERFKLLTFTGSAAVGWRLKSKAGKKRVTLELGGNAGCLVHGDADIDRAVQQCVTGGFSFAGQSCISVQRIFVHRPARERFLQALVERVESLNVGDPLDERTDLGAMITEEAARRVETWIQEAVTGGAKALTGGRREVSVVYPTVLVDTTPEMKVNCQEVFGPVVTVEAYDHFEKALEAVNDSPAGLQAGVFTNNLRMVFEAFKRLEVGGVIVNDVPTFRTDHMPYGGMKDSGLGREGARYAIEEMTERKLLVLNLSE